MKKGIDISAYQGVVDFNKVKKSGIDVVILRAGWGTGTKDKTFETNYKKAKEAGLKVGIYWFLYCTNDTQAQQNAIACCNVLKGKQIDYPVYADQEYDSATYYLRVTGHPLTKDVASRLAKVFLETCKKAGYAVGNYTNLDWYRNYYTNEINNRYDLWLAYWGSATQMCKDSAIWQYSSKGRVNGIVGNVDMDEVHKEYPIPTPAPVPDVPVNPSNDSYPIPKIYDLVFDAKWYFNRYPDLQEAVKAMISSGGLKNDENAIAWWLYQHFLTFGMEEADNGRYGCASFDVKKYKSAYPDLQKAFGDASWKPYYYHYMQTGALEIKEGKRAKVDLSV